MTHLQRAPFPVFDSNKLISEADLLGELLKQVDAESAAALIKALILLRRLNVHPEKRRTTGNIAGPLAHSHVLLLSPFIQRWNDRSPIIRTVNYSFRIYREYDKGGGWAFVLGCHE